MSFLVTPLLLEVFVRIWSMMFRKLCFVFFVDYLADFLTTLQVDLGLIFRIDMADSSGVDGTQVDSSSTSGLKRKSGDIRWK